MMRGTDPLFVPLATLVGTVAGGVAGALAGPTLGSDARSGAGVSSMAMLGVMVSGLGVLLSSVVFALSISVDSGEWSWWLPVHVLVVFAAILIPALPYLTLGAVAAVVFRRLRLPDRAV